MRAATLPVGCAEVEGAAALGKAGRVAEAAGKFGKAREIGNAGEAETDAGMVRHVTEDQALSSAATHATSAAKTRHAATVADNELTKTAAASNAAKPTGTGAKFADAKTLDIQFQKHGSDFGSLSAIDYQHKANEFLTGTKSADILEKTRPNGDKMRFNPKTDEFGVISKSGAIRTYYKLEATAHGFSSNLAYFNAQ